MIVPPLALVDVIYVTPWVVGAVLLQNVPSRVTLLLVPLFAASWWQDWKSARTATTYFSGELVGFDLLTAGNYIALAHAWRKDVPHEDIVGLSTLVHWTLIFAIYIAWNLVIIRKADPSTRRAFISFSLAEAPLVVIGALLIASQTVNWTEPRWIQPIGVATLAAAHVALLVLWRIMSSRNEA